MWMELWFFICEKLNAEIFGTKISGYGEKRFLK